MLGFFDSTGGSVPRQGGALHKTVARRCRKLLILTHGVAALAGSARLRGEATSSMAKSDEPVTIKKYANRRLYNTGTSTYVTLEDLATMVKAGEDFVVFDAKTGEDITRSVLTQIIFEQENKEGGQNLLPINFLRQLIRFYGDSMQMLVPRYLEVSIDSLTREQENSASRCRRRSAWAASAPIEEQVRRNMEMFERTFAMFAPFARQGAGRRPAPTKPTSRRAAAPATTSTSSSGSSTRCRSASTASATRTRS